MTSGNKKKEIPVNDSEAAESSGKVSDPSESGEYLAGTGEFSLLEDQPGESGVSDMDSTTPSGNELSAEKEEIARLTDLWQRERANFINYKRRVDADKSEIRKYAIYDFALGVVRVLDYFESSVSFGENLPDEARNVILGVEYTIEELKRILSAHGVTPVETEIGAAFDSSVMEAVEIQQDSGAEPGAVLAVRRSGWWFHDRVLRAAQVVVAGSERDTKGGEGPDPVESDKSVDR